MLLDRLYRHRYAATLGSLLILLYCHLYLWLFIPFSAFEFNWRPDHRLHVKAVAADSPAAPYLQPGDSIVTIDGRPARPATVFFPPTARQSQYELQIERDDVRFTAVVPFLTQPDAYAFQLRAASGILSLITWAVGAIALHFSWRENQQALRLGGVFLLASVVVTSWNATLMGVPLAWMTAQPLLFLLAVGWVYLGCLPRYGPLSARGRLAFAWLLGIAVLFGGLAFFEAALLFPRGSSLQQLSGISLYQLTALSQALGGGAMFVLLLIRRVLVKTPYLRQQLNILLAFVGIGFLPAVFLSFLPLGLWGQPMLPIPIAILGLVMVPLGYLYVIFRHAYLGLDGTLGRSIPYVLLVVISTALYGLSLRAFDTWFGGELNLILPAVLLFVLLAALAPRSKVWLDAKMHTLFFGPVLSTPGQLRAFADEVAHRPDLVTLQRIIQRVCETFDIPKATLSLKNGRKLLGPTIQLGDPAWPEKVTDDWLLDRTAVRTVQYRRGQLPLCSTYCPGPRLRCRSARANRRLAYGCWRDHATAISIRMRSLFWNIRRQRWRWGRKSSSCSIRPKGSAARLSAFRSRSSARLPRGCTISHSSA